MELGVRGWRAVGLAVLTAVVLAIGAASPAGAVSLLQVGTFAEPVYVTAPPGDPSRIFVVQRTGKIVAVHNGVSSTFLDITSRVRSSGGEQGLLSMAFAPDYATSGTFYVYYNAQPPGGSGATGSDLTISAFQRVDPDHADPGSERAVLQIPHRKFDNHNGGNLQFGPDGMLWLGTGDGGNNNDPLGNAQQTSPSWNDAAAGHDARLGKLLRVDPRPGAGCDGRCTIPAGNPGFAQPEIWAKGLRNPWRFSFDRVTGDLIIGDVGEGTWEEVDFAPAPAREAGADYGWNVFEGLHPRGSTEPAGAPPGVTMPELEKAHAAPDSFSSIAGGYVVRDPALPDLLGRYVYADTFRGDIRAVTLTAGGATGDVDTGLHVSTLASFGEDTCGRVYAVSLEGPVYRLAQSGDCALLPSAGGPGVTPPVTPGAPGAGAGAGGPGVKVAAATRQRPWTTGVVRARVSCEQICDIIGRGTFLISKANKNAGAAAVVKLLRTAPAKTTLAAGATVTVKAKVSATVRRSLLRALQRGRRITLRFAVTATDRAGRTKTTSARSRITRR